MSLPEFIVDFNEMVYTKDDHEGVLLSREDLRKDKNGEMVLLKENMPIIVFCEDTDSYGNPDRLIAKGIAVLNTSDFLPNEVKWCCEFTSELVHENEDNFWLEN